MDSSSWLLSPTGGRRKHLSTIIEDIREFGGSEPESDSASLADSIQISSQAGTFNDRDKQGAFGYPRVPEAGRRQSMSASVDTGGKPSFRHKGSPDRILEFDDLYDATDESNCDSDSDSYASSPDMNADERSKEPSSRRHKYPLIFIPPHSSQSERIMGSKLNSPVPPTPPPKIPVSPEALSRLPRTVPPIYDAPSLAGSTTESSSAHPSNPSAPPTPQLGPVPDAEWDEYRLRVYSDYESNKGSVPSSRSMSPQLDIQLETPEDWSTILEHFPPVPQERRIENDPIAGEDEGQESAAESVSVKSSNKGVQLPRGALDTLRNIDIDDRSSLSSVHSDVDEIGQMREFVPPNRIRRRSTGGFREPTTAGSDMYTPLSVPSPGGFFASLSRDSRRTWCLNNNPPSSATAENFYAQPWEAPADSIVEQVVNVEEDDDDTVGPPTARRILSETATEDQTLLANSTAQDVDLMAEYDELYEDELKRAAAANFDRTGTWLAAQSAYLSALAEANPMNKVGELRIGIGVISEDDVSEAVGKKSVRFLDTILEEFETSDRTPVVPKNSLFFRGFEHVRKQSRKSETVNYSHLRFEAIQAARCSLMEKYVDHLSGKYESSEPIRPPYRGPFALAPRNSTLPQTLLEKAMYADVEKEQDVLKQIQHVIWAIEALKYLNGGRLIVSPAARRFAREPRLLPSPNAPRNERRILDLGGHPTCDWGWYVAGEYPKVKVSTVITNRHPVNLELKGPVNHRHVAVPWLWNLPFPEGQFDMISSRNLHMLLKSSRLVDGLDEYDQTLTECFRCLKPGGYLEFFIMDAELVRAGPYGSATSVEFGFNLKTRGYDPWPTKSFLSRLKKAGFVDTRRMWVFLPMGMPRETDDATDVAEGERDIGRTSAVANTTGIFGGWMWEQWVLKLRTEMDHDKDNFLVEMSTVFEEGRKTGAGWRCLTGWARKPRTGGSGKLTFPKSPPPLPPRRPPSKS